MCKTSKKTWQIPVTVADPPQEIERERARSTVPKPINTTSLRFMNAIY